MLIQDRNHYEKFIEKLPELERDEVYFLSLSARNKYLDEKERSMFGLSKTEMFARQIAFDKNGIEYALKKMEATLSYKRTRTEKTFPEKALVCYININPSSTIKAYRHFKIEMDRHLEEAFFATINKKEGSFSPFRRIERNLLNEVQKATARRCFVDIDIDSGEDDRPLFEFLCFCREKGIRAFPIKTRSGFHTLMKKETIGKTNIYEKVKELDLKCEGEVIINKNAMVPIPGTLQGGKLVKMI